MASKNILLLKDGDMSANITTDPVDVDNVSIIAVQADARGGGSPNGTIKVQASCDPTDPARFPVVWTDIPDSSQTVNNDEVFLWNFANIGYSWIRVVYEATSGTDTLDIRVQLKG